MDKLIEKGTNYLPVALFADESVMTQENKLLATPDSMKDDVEKGFETRILTENQAIDAAKAYVKKVPKNLSYSENAEKLGGKLSSENDRYYYSIDLNGAELRILYNWYYDFARRHGFDSQDINNPSVCFEIVKNDFKFLSCGDLGGNCENGLLNYYAGTNILSDVTLYKASHHGSTTNGENSKELFSIAKPEIIVVTGCAQSPKDVTIKTAA